MHGSTESDTRCITVFLYASDPVSQQGIEGLLRGCGRVRIVGDVDACGVAVVVADAVGHETARVISGLQRDGVPRVVLVVPSLDSAGLLRAIEAGVAGIVYRDQADASRLGQAVIDAAEGRASLPSDAAGTLLARLDVLQRQVLQPRGISLRGLSDREISVLRLLAEGLDTDEVADQLHYSARTVKGVLQDVTRRYQLKNRTHAVVFAIRQGLI